MSQNLIPKQALSANPFPHVSHPWNFPVDLLADVEIWILVVAEARGEGHHQEGRQQTRRHHHPIGLLTDGKEECIVGGRSVKGIISY